MKSSSLLAVVFAILATNSSVGQIVISTCGLPVTSECEQVAHSTVTVDEPCSGAFCNYTDATLSEINCQVIGGQAKPSQTLSTENYVQEPENASEGVVMSRNGAEILCIQRHECSCPQQWQFVGEECPTGSLLQEWKFTDWVPEGTPCGGVGGI